MDLKARLREIGHDLPPAAKPVADYLPAVRDGGRVVVSGQLPMKDGQLVAAGLVPSACSLETAQAGAEQAVLNGLAAVDAVIEGRWDTLERVVRVGVFVASDPGFTEQHLVANAASGLLAQAFGEAGRHARAAVGVPSLPLGAAVEVELLLAFGN